MKSQFKLKAWAYVINDGEQPPLVPWGAGKYWQLPIFPTRNDARKWRQEHDSYPAPVRLVRVVVSSCPKPTAKNAAKN